MPKVSVVITTRNRKSLLLERSLPSVLNQSFKDFEVIVINDASDEEYPSEYEDKRVIYMRNFNRMGLAFNKNLGIDYSKGEYLVFLDDDNEFHPDFLASTVDFLERSGMAAVGVEKIIKYPEGNVLHHPKVPCAINDGFLFRRNLFQSIRFDADLHGNEDADFGIRFFKAGYQMPFLTKSGLMTVYGSPIFNTTSYSDYTDYHIDGLASFWLKHHEYAEYIGRIFMLRSGKKWFRWMYWLGTKLKRYYQIWSSRARH